MAKKLHPCDECPFRRTSTRGWLGGSTPDEEVGKAEGAWRFIHEVMADVPGNPLCHMNNETLCVGALIMANKSCKRYRSKEVADVAAKLKDDPKVMGVLEFVEHHTLTRKGK